MFDVLKKLYPYAKPFWNSFIVASLCAIPMASIQGFQAYYVKEIFDKGLSPGSTTEDILGKCGVLLGLHLVLYPFRFYHHYTLRLIVEKVVCRMREELFKKFQSLPLSFYDKSKKGDLLSVATYDTVYFASAMRHVISIFREPLTALILLGVAFYNDWPLTLFILAAIPFFGAIFSYTGKKVKKYVNASQSKMGLITQSLTEGIQGQKIIKAFNLQKYLGDNFEKLQASYYESQKKAFSYEEHSHPMVELVGNFALAAIIVYAHQRIVGRHLSTGGFISFAAALALFMEPIKKFNQANISLNHARAACNRIFDVIRVESEDEGQKEFKGFEKNIEIQNLSFRYHDNLVFDHFNLKINKGEKVAFVGPSGAGKSTIFLLLQKFYSPQEGNICIDGVDIRELKLEELRKNFSYVGQDIFLFNDSVEENIKMGDELTSEQLEEMLKLSYAKDFVRNMPEGIKTQVGDRGTMISGGQGQRLTIARALVKNAPIVLFDEATSALDNDSERIVQKNMEEFLKEKTVIAVAHRLSTIVNYDRIIFLKAGKVVEEGTHSELMNLNGEYKKLYELSIKNEVIA
ncbi:MAG: ABC transporter ATP-binding protein [Halobacteriovoraceae bacterium]|nr:ABC transporter ATP-binding protein [Halobacteriovoraceae bacterium]MCB9095940.1 ABC transporter ATP-binding protein [Halobacteriovoraceae bacterium]